MSTYRRIAFTAYPAHCDCCHSTDALHVHHRNKDRSNNSVENLQILCPPCHVKAHKTEPKTGLDAPKTATFLINTGLKFKTNREARRRGISVSELVRELLTKALEKSDDE